MSQCTEILDYMKEHGSIEPMQALHQLGVYRLASRINDLRMQGHNIITQMIKTRNNKRHARYSLEDHD